MTQISITVNDMMPNEVIALAQKMKEEGHNMPMDFTFEYHPPKFDEYSGDAIYNRHVVFTFHKEELATWFSLKYL